MTTLLAEDLLLLLLDDESGALDATTDPTPALGGALLLELALDDAVEVHARRWAGDVVRPTAQGAGAAGSEPRDPLLEAALATVAEKERTPQDLVQRLGKGVKEQLAERLVGRGVLEVRRDKVLGLFPRTRWPARDSSHEDAVRRSLTAVLVGGAEPDPRTAALVALLHATGRAHKVVDHQGIPAGQVRRRAKEVAEGAWAAEAVRRAVSAATAAVVSSIAVGAAVSSGG